MEEPQPSLQPHVQDCRNDRITGKIRDILLSQASALNSSVIERRIQELFNSFNTPTHPPYALMIQRALMEMDEENGSTEEAISEFIKKEFNDLPWAHTRILGLHLRKLCQAEELLCTESGRYMLMVDSGDFGERKESEWRGSERSKRSRRRRNHRGGKRNKKLERNEGTERDNELQEEENEEENQLSDLHGTGTNEMIEEQGKSEIWLLRMSEERHGRAQNEAKKPQNNSMDERIQEAMTGLNQKIGSSDIVNTEPLMAKEQQDIAVKKHIQFEKQPYELLAVAENQTPTQQLEVTTEISRFCSDEKSKDENLSTLLGGPAVAVIPKDNLQTLGQEEEQQQNETPSEQQKFPDACELLVDQEDPIFHLETTCSSQPTARNHPVDPTSNFWKHPIVPVSTESPEHIPSVEADLTLAQLKLQISKFRPSESDFCAASKMSASLSYMNVREHNQPHGWTQERLDENTTFGDPEQQPPKPRRSGRQPNPKLEDYKIKKQWQLQPRGRGRGRGRGSSPQLDSNPHKHKEQLQLQDQYLDPVSFPNFEPKETVHSSQPAPDLPVLVTPKHQQQLANPISEGNLGCIPSTEKEILPIQLQLQMSWRRLIDRDLGITSKMETSLSSMNFYEDKPRQHGNKRNPKQKFDLDDETDFGDPGQRPPKYRRRRSPPNPEPVEDCSQVSFLPTNDGIHKEKSPNFHNIVRQSQMEARGRGRGKGRCRGQERLPKLDHNEHHPKLDSTVDGSCQNPLLLPQCSNPGRGRRELQQLKTTEGLGGSLQPISNVHQGHQLQPKSSCRRLLRSNSTLRQGS